MQEGGDGSWVRSGAGRKAGDGPHPVTSLSAAGASGETRLQQLLYDPSGVTLAPAACDQPPDHAHVSDLCTRDAVPTTPRSGLLVFQPLSCAN